MQEVCNSLDSGIVVGSQIKTESSNGIPGNCVPSLPPNSASVLSTKLSAVNCEKQLADSSYWMPTESGFINSQPSMAEFLTHVEPESPKVNHGYPVTNIDSCESVPEYPWMKEKKTSRKSNVQGNCHVSPKFKNPNYWDEFAKNHGRNCCYRARLRWK